MPSITYNVLLTSASGLISCRPDPHLSVMQGVYKINWTNFQEIPEGISKKNPGYVCIASACYAMYWIYYI